MEARRQDQAGVEGAVGRKRGYMETTADNAHHRHATTLQRRVMEEIGRRNAAPGELARTLGLLPVGAEVLLARQERWG